MSDEMLLTEACFQRRYIANYCVNAIWLQYLCQNLQFDLYAFSNKPDMNWLGRVNDNVDAMLLPIKA